MNHELDFKGGQLNFSPPPMRSEIKGNSTTINNIVIFFCNFVIISIFAITNIQIPFSVQNFQHCAQIIKNLARIHMEFTIYKGNKLLDF